MKTFRNFIHENMVLETADPPMLLQMRRMAIRNYPNGERVALYTNPQLSISIAIPYDYTTGKLKPSNMLPIKENAPHRLYGEWEDEVKSKGATTIQRHRAPLGYAGKSKGHTIAYNGDQVVGTWSHDYGQGNVKEEVLQETPMHRINTILRKGEEDEVLFHNGATSRVHPVTAKAVHDLWHKVNSSNKMKLSELINSSPEGLVKVAKFASDLVNKEAKK